MKTLDELAMEYAIVSLGIDHNKTEGVFDLRPTITLGEHHLDRLKDQMFREFGGYEATQAITRAEEIVRMVIPGEQS